MERIYQQQSMAELGQVFTLVYPLSEDLGFLLMQTLGWGTT